MGRIRILDPLVANHIAAGEVVERPASVVKELVENSLDAGATRVEIELDDGGRERIEVRDDGCGIDAGDAPLAFARFGTSKVAAIDDLGRIATYGFRGEALPSIAAVARVRLESRPADAEWGVVVEVEGAATVTARPLHTAAGTRIVVRDLFFNTPARLAFLRGAATELGHVMRLVEALALARPDLTLRLRANGRQIFDFVARPSLAARAADVFGGEIAADLHDVAADGPYRVEGLLSGPATHRGSPASLHLVVDGRSVRDRTLSGAVLAGYGELLDRGRHPVGVVHLHAPAGAVDVNVHPTKAEVRFASTRAVHAAVGEAVRALLARAPWRRPEPSAQQLALEVAPRARAAAGATTAAAPWPAADPATRAARSSSAWQPVAPVETFGPARGAVSRPRAPGDAAPSPALDRPAPAVTVAAPPTTRPPAPSAAAVEPVILAASIATPAAAPASRATPPASRRVLGTVGDRWLVATRGDDMEVFDLHALHEAVLATRLRAGLRQGGVDGEHQIIPKIIALDEPARVALTSAAAAAALARLGVELSEAGPRAMLARRLPAVIGIDRAEPVVQALAAALAAGTAADAAALVGPLACAAALAPGQPSGPQFAEGLLVAAAGISWDEPGPHGTQLRRIVDAATLAALFAPPARDLP